MPSLTNQLSGRTDVERCKSAHHALDDLSSLEQPDEWSEIFMNLRRYLKIFANGLEYRCNDVYSIYRSVRIFVHCIVIYKLYPVDSTVHSQLEVIQFGNDFQRIPQQRV